MSAVIGIIQARMGSSRVPGKAMIKLAGKPLIWHMIDRMRRVTDVGPLVLATTSDVRNRPLIEYCRGQGLDIFQHPDEDDLAGRALGGGAADGPGPRGLVVRGGGDGPRVREQVRRALL